MSGEVKGGKETGRESTAEMLQSYDLEVSCVFK